MELFWTYDNLDRFNPRRLKRSERAPTQWTLVCVEMFFVLTEFALRVLCRLPVFRVTVNLLSRQFLFAASFNRSSIGSCLPRSVA